MGGEHIDELYQKGYNIIIAFWHGRQLMMPLTYRGKLAYILISQHRDGELIYRIVRRFGFRSVRGSTTRGGSGALRQLIRLSRQGADLCDHPGWAERPSVHGAGWACVFSQAYGASHCSINLCLFKKKTFSSWDQFILPYPGGKGNFHLGESYLGRFRSLTD